MIEVELRGVRKSFGRTVAVAGIDLAVERGEFVALLGPSGCGKTTTLRIIAGFEQPDAGEVVVRGRSITGLPPHRRDIGIVFQSYALFPHMSVLDNVAYGLRVRSRPRDEIARRVAGALDLVRLRGLERRHPRELSGGQQQRVALARAIVIQPTVLLLDEPLSNLDAKLRQEMRSELRQLQRRLEVATIFVTHDQDEALAMADRIVVMNEGRAEQVGTAEEIYSRPRTRFVASFIGLCNFLPGEVVRVDADRLTLDASGLTVSAAADGARVGIGARGILAVRPEAIRVLRPGEPAPTAANIAAGQVREVTYLGASRHFRVALATGQELFVVEQNTGGRTVKPGEAVTLAWAPDAASFQPEEGAR